MLKETSQDKGCLRGCLFSVILGGFLGAAAIYVVVGRHLGNGSQDQGFYMLIRVGYSALGFLAGTLLWGIGHWVYVRFIAKGDEEDTI